MSQEINEQVARKMGWTYHEDTGPVHWKSPSSKYFSGVLHTEVDGSVYLMDLPDYSGSIAAAWEIAEKLPVFSLSRIGKVWHCSLMGGDYAVSDAAPMAICLAFLKLNEEEA